VVPNVIGHDVEAVDAAIKKAKLSDKPTLICCKTVIGKARRPRPAATIRTARRSARRKSRATREALGWKWAPFEIPAEVYAAWDAKEAGAQNEGEWNKVFAAYEAKYPQEAAEFTRRMAKQLPADWAQKAQAIIAGANERAETIATRKASQQAIEGLSTVLPELLGGSADLTGSNLTNWKATKPVRVRGRPRSRQPRQLRRARIRHERDHQRHRGCMAASRRSAAPS
jgi:transketolase